MFSVIKRNVSWYRGRTASGVQEHLTFEFIGDRVMDKVIKNICKVVLKQQQCSAFWQEIPGVSSRTYLTEQIWFCSVYDSAFSSKPWLVLWIFISSSGASSYVPFASIFSVMRELLQVDAHRQVSEALWCILVGLLLPSCSIQLLHRLWRSLVTESTSHLLFRECSPH